MNEIHKFIGIYYDGNKEKEVEDSINFGLIPAGSKTEKELFIFNKTNYPIDVDFELTEKESISIIKDFNKILPTETKKIVFSFNPKLTHLKPIKPKFNIKIRFVI